MAESATATDALLLSTILGRKVLNEYIALGVYGLTGLGAWAAMRGGSSEKKVPEIDPKVQSTSAEEAAFLENFINDLEHKEKATAKH
ncbi:hypothetical protein JCM10207_005369 [Rhodosporidiobolus poonsookiae]